MQAWCMVLVFGVCLASDAPTRGPSTHVTSHDLLVAKRRAMSQLLKPHELESVANMTQLVVVNSTGSNSTLNITTESNTTNITDSGNATSLTLQEQQQRMEELALRIREDQRRIQQYQHAERWAAATTTTQAHQQNSVQLSAQPQIPIIESPPHAIDSTLAQSPEVVAPAVVLAQPPELPHDIRVPANLPSPTEAIPAQIDAFHISKPMTNTGTLGGIQQNMPQVMVPLASTNDGQTQHLNQIDLDAPGDSSKSSNSGDSSGSSQSSQSSQSSKSSTTSSTSSSASSADGGSSDSSGSSKDSSQSSDSSSSSGESSKSSQSNSSSESSQTSSDSSSSGLDSGDSSGDSSGPNMLIFAISSSFSSNFA